MDFKNIIRQLSAIVFLFLCSACFQSIKAQDTPSTNARYPLIPFPQMLSPKEGQFTINKNTTIVADQKIFANETEQLQSLLRMRLKVEENAPAENFIEIKQDNSLANDEGYVLDIGKNKITITAKTGAGAFRAIETIRQLLPNSIENLTTKANIRQWNIPEVYIKDYPKYAYRGMHFDVSRHFFSIAYLKKYIDRMALYKFNKLHLHLTDDEGWRIEIKKYPKLTENGAWRTLDTHDSACIARAKKDGDPDMELDSSHIKIVNGKTLYGGFYTQDEMKGLVKYALERHIDIIPEIDMPGHSKVAITQYPYLACGTAQEQQFNFSVPMCPCNEATFTFAENVYSEIFKIFPYEYVHLGADEVNKSSWAKSDACKAVMQKEGLKDVEELQSYFVKRMEKFFNAHGKKLIGWDEILGGGVSPTAIVMYWRSWVPNAPIKAAKNGNKVIMTPGNPLYFDAIPDNNSLMRVYHFNPIPKGLTPKEADNIIGAQANTWTEYIPTTNRVEYMEYPRMLALAEVLWTNKTNDSSFLHRLNYQYKRMDALGIHYRLPDIQGLVQNNVFINKAVLDIHPPMDGLTLRYTTNGVAPTINSPVLNKAVRITEAVTYKIAAFNKLGSRGEVKTIAYQKTSLSPAVMVKRNYTGLNVSYFRGFTPVVDSLDKKTSEAQWNQPNLVLDKSKIIDDKSFGLILMGVITVPENGIYSFYLTSDDGSVLYIDNKTVVDNDGMHSFQEKSGQVGLEKGSHFFKVKFLNGSGDYQLQLKYCMPGSLVQKDIPDSWFK